MVVEKILNTCSQKNFLNTYNQKKSKIVVSKILRNISKDIYRKQRYPSKDIYRNKDIHPKISTRKQRYTSKHIYPNISIEKTNISTQKYPSKHIYPKISIQTYL